MRRRYELCQRQWERIAPLLPHPTHQDGRGPPWDPHPPLVNALLWICHTGAPWRDLPARYGPWSTVACRFRRWRLAGVWDRILATVQQDEDAAGHVDWTLQFVDGTRQHLLDHLGGDAPLAQPECVLKREGHVHLDL